MKVVINRCYGGFGLSEKATLRLLELGSKHIALIEPKQYYGGREGWEEKFKEDSVPGRWRTLVKDGKVVVDSDYRSDNRDCPLLVQVVEEMGEEANGGCAELKVVEVPDDIEYEIDDYDGIEHIAESHRTWR